VTAALSAALVAANSKPGGETVPGSVYYGICDSTAYAVASFMPGPGATLQQSIAFQDAGSVAHYFLQTAGRPWTLVGSAPFPQITPGCGKFVQLPAALRAIWADCPRH
jgi:hypothetical protein